MKNLLRISIIAYIHLIFNAQNIELTISSFGYSLVSYAILFNACRAFYEFVNGKTHTQIKKEVLNV